MKCNLQISLVSEGLDQEDENELSKELRSFFGRRNPARLSFSEPFVAVFGNNIIGYVPYNRGNEYENI